MNNMDNNLYQESISLFDFAIKCYNDCKYKEAIKALDILLREYIEYIVEYNIHEWLGLCYTELKDYEKANYHLEKALSTKDSTIDDMEYFEIYEGLGYANYMLEKYKIALEYYENGQKYALGLPRQEWARDQYIFFLNKGKTNFMLNNEAIAIKNYTMAEEFIRVTPPSQEREIAFNIIKFLKGECYLYMQELTIAREFLEDVNGTTLTGSMKRDYYFTLGVLYMRLEKYARAIKAFEKHEPLIDSESDRGKLYYYLGLTYYRKGNKQKSKEYLKKALKCPINAKWMNDEIQDIINEL